MNHKVLKQASIVLTVIALLFLTAGLVRESYGFDVKPGGGVELFEIREMEGGNWEASFNKGVSGGVIFDLELIPLLDPQLKFSLHPGVEMGEGKFRLAGSAVLGIFPWLDGKIRLIEVGAKRDFTGKPEGTANPYSILIMTGFGWGGGE